MHKLEEFQIKRHLSDQALGSLIGLHYTNIGRIKRNYAVPRPEVLSKLIALSNGELTYSDFYPPANPAAKRGK